MEEVKGSFRERLALAVIQTIILGGVMAYIDHRLNVHLESVKTALQVTTPLVQQRLFGYIEIQRDAQDVNWRLEAYYSRAKQPRTSEAMSGKLAALENAMHIGSGATGGDIVSAEDVTHALDELIKAKERYAYHSQRSSDPFRDRALRDPVASGTSSY
jgi:hypothetical protein